jgi:murein DD-endopeptidase MepM/ murein hydrolase activator NlpD
VTLENEGPANGKWLVSSWQRDLLAPTGTLTLVKPGATVPEPVGAQTGNGYKPPKDSSKFQSLSGPVQPIPTGYPLTVEGLHPTAGLAGYEARDWMCAAGTPVVACENGTVERFSGHDPLFGPTDGVHGPFGWSIYLKGASGTDYYYTHLGSRVAKLGQVVQAGTVLGAVGDYAKWGGANHVHLGVHPGPSGHPDINDIYAAPRATKKTAT